MRTVHKRGLAIAAIAAVGLAGAGYVTASAASAGTGCAVEYSVGSQWQGGFVASVTVKNLGDAVSSWKLAWSFGSGQRVASAWNAVVDQNGNQVTAANAGHNGSLAANAATSFGIQGTWNANNPSPANFTFNGVSCTGVPAASGTTSVPAASGTSAASTPGCPAAGRITYTLNRVANPTADQSDAYQRITVAMDQAVAMYNCYTNVTKALSISYNPSVPTADGNINGSIRFGAKSTMQRITAMHEIAHTLGVGTSGAWPTKISNKIWTGSNATNALRTLTGDQSAVLHADSQHFWPYGLNYTSEVKSDADLVIHCKIVAELRRDMGL